MYQRTLSGSNFISDAIDLLKKHEPKEGYHLAFSGGKDSITIFDLAIKANVQFDAHFSQTTVDPPSVLKFIKEYYPEVIWEKPKKPMFQIIVDHGTPPTRFKRYCCRELKEIGGKGRTVILGIRASESARRANRNLFEESEITKGKFFCNPVLYWKDEDIWDYINKNEIAYPDLYDLGRTRIGCILCPLQCHKGRLQDILDFPKFYRAYIRSFERMLEKIKKEDKSNPLGWETGEQVMDWWINGDQIIKHKDHVRWKRQNFRPVNTDLELYSNL